MKPMLRSRAMALLAALVLLSAAGCASTPEASAARDAEAKRFGAAPAQATIYVYRPYPGEGESVLRVDDRLIGATMPRTYFRFEVVPGHHIIEGLAFDSGHLTLETRAGATYFVAVSVSAGTSRFQLIAPRTAQKVIADCCGLMENWAPGQRPLIR